MMLELRNMPLMKEKVDYVIENTFKLLHNMSFIRRYLEIYPYKSNIDIDSFIRIGYKNIIDKAFFVKDFNNVYYDYKSLSNNYARGISQGEIMYVLNTIEKEKVVNSINKIINKKDDLKDLFDTFYPGSENILFANPTYFSEFWELGKMEWKEGKPTGFYWINEAPIYFSTQISENNFIYCNPKAIEIYFKEDLKTLISTISETEKENIIKRNPEYISENLDEKVLIEVYELIKCETNVEYDINQIILNGDYIESKLK